MNGYKAFYKGKSIEVYAETSYDACFLQGEFPNNPKDRILKVLNDYITKHETSLS